MNEQKLRSHIRKQLIKEFFPAMFAAAASEAVLGWLNDDAAEDIEGALEDMQDAAEELKDVVEDAVDEIESDAIADVIRNAAATSLDTLQQAINEIAGSLKDEIASTIEGDEELADSIPIGEADNMANFAVLAAVAQAVLQLTSE